MALSVSACTTPSDRDIEFLSIELSKPLGIKKSTLERTRWSFFGSDTLIATVEMESGAVFRFERVGYASFGPNASNIVLSEASGLVPRIASCDSVGPVNLHRAAPVGHHFTPSLIDLKDAIMRAGDVLEEIHYWPHCPMSWEVQDQRGVNYRYCVHRKDAPADPPRPQGCAAQ
jgi:hypothetical protein